MTLPLRELEPVLEKIAAHAMNIMRVGDIAIYLREGESDSFRAGQNLIITDRGDGSYLIRFDGIPGPTYRVEWNSNVADPEWQPLGSATANAFGVFQFIDTPPVGSLQRYYRSVCP